MYPSQQKRYDAILAATASKLQARKDELFALSLEERAKRLIDEALTEFYDDRVAANNDFDLVERIVWNLVRSTAPA